MKKKKIGIVSEYFYPHLGGITEHVYYYSKELLKRGFEVVILTGYEGESATYDPLPGLRIIHMGKSFPFFSNGSFAKVTLDWNIGKKVRRVLAEEKFDLLHIQSPLTPVLPLAFQQLSQTLTIGTMHTYFEKMIFYKIFQKQVQAHLDRLDGVIAVSPSCIEAMSQYFTGNYTVIPNGVDRDWFANSKGKIKKYDDGSPNVLFLGRLDPRNGLETLIDSFPHVLKEVPEARLLVLGDGPLRPVYEERAAGLLNQKIFFEGQINEDRPDYFATSRVFCYPATKASFGITLLEAMAAGVPVVATDNKGFKDMIQHGENGLLVKQEDPVDLAQGIVRVLKDKELEKRLIEKGSEMADQFSWSHVTDRILDFYNQTSLKKLGVPFVSA